MLYRDQSSLFFLLTLCDQTALLQSHLEKIRLHFFPPFFVGWDYFFLTSGMSGQRHRFSKLRLSTLAKKMSG
jgi:hypothetical protein